MRKIGFIGPAFKFYQIFVCIRFAATTVKYDHYLIQLKQYYKYYCYNSKFIQIYCLIERNYVFLLL